MTIQELLDYGVEQLAQCSTAKLEVEILLMQILSCKQTTLRAYPELVVSNQLCQQFNKWLKRRAQGEPIAYIIGQQQFWNFTVMVTKDVLVPRADTEVLIEQALNNIKLNNQDNRQINILDLGTGSGIIAIALALELPKALIYAIDSSLPALTLAKQNAINNNANNIKFVHGNWFAPVVNMQEQFYCIVSNPPYIAEHDPHLQAKELKFEPQSALVSGVDGMEALRLIIQQSYQYLQPGGWLLVEHGYNQAELVAELFLINNYKNIKSSKDLAGHIRVSAGCK